MVPGQGRRLAYPLLELIAALNETKAGLAGPTRDDPYGVNDARDVTQQRQQDVEPELAPKPDREEHAHGREHDGKKDPKKVGHDSIPG